MYLMVQNPGVADAFALTTLGVSTTRYANRPGTVGMFGSGYKLALAKFFRENYNLVICPDKLTMEFFTKPKLVDGKTFNHVCVKYSGKDLDGKTKNSTNELGFCAEWGVLDWKKLGMAFREIISNAIDGATLSGGNYKDVVIAVKDTPRAKSGYTSVFIPFTSEIQTLWNSVGKLFLHFSNPEYLNRKLLPKTDPDTVYIYKNGVLASHFKGKSVFDYNLSDELTLDESRNASMSDVRYACALAIADAEPSDLAKILLAQIFDGTDVFENDLESYYLYKEDKKANFQTAFNATCGENAVACSGEKTLADFVERKGFKPVKVAPNWFQVLERYGISTQNKVLDGLEKEGMQEYDATPEQIEAVDKVWNLVQTCDLTNGKPKPPVKSFQPIMNAESQIGGQYKNGTVYLHKELGGTKLLKVALEEVVHFITNSSDFSRDFQDYLLRLIV